MFFSDDDTTFLEEVKEILPVSADISREKLWPFLEQAERKYILPLLGREAFDDLNTYYNNHDNWTSGSGDDETKTAELLRLVQISVINLAFYIGFDVLNVSLAAAGFQRVEGETFKGLYKYQETNLKSYFSDTGFNGLDDVLAYLEDNVEYFPEWEDSETAAALRSAIIKDTATFNGIISIKNSRIIFLRLQGLFNQVLDLEIYPVIGTDISTALQEDLAEDEHDDDYAALAVQLRKPLAYLSVATLIETSGNLTERGLYFEGKNSIFPDDSTIKTAEGSLAAERVAYYRTIGERYLAAVRQWLTDNEWEGYTQPTGTIYTRDNTDKKTFFT